jgi:cellulose synthase/poly-beta-1,6-N-acetylglucosamine synthase-like glycosyltransferase
MGAKLFWFCISSIFYTYLGYPVILTLLARLKPYRPMVIPPTGTIYTPLVTMLITAYKEEEVIAKKLDNTLAIDYPEDRLQILVAVDESEDRTVEIVRSYCDLGVELSYSSPRRGKTAAINRTIPSARGEIVIFSDANNFYEKHTLKELVKPFVDPSVGAVSGAKTIAGGDGSLGESESLYWKYESFIKLQETRLGSCTGVAGEVFAVRRDLIESLPEEIINDDFYIAMQVFKRGYRVSYVPTARSVERVSATAQDEILRRSRIVAGRYQAMFLTSKLLPWDRPLIVWQLVSHKYLRPLVPFAMIGAVLSNLLAVFWPVRDQKRSFWRLSAPWGSFLLYVQILFYVFAYLGNYVQAVGKFGKIFYLPTFLVNSNVAALRGLYKYLAKQNSPRWQRVQRRAAGTMRPRQ